MAPGETGAGPPGRVLDLPARVESIDVVQDELAALWAAEPSVSVRDRVRFETAVVEILGNIVEHAVNVDPPEADGRRIRVDLRCEETRLAAHLADDGRPMAIDLASVTMPEADEITGRGLPLALAAVEEVHYERVDHRNQWRLICHRQP